LRKVSWSWRCITCYEGIYSVEGQKLKARLMVKDFIQVDGVDYNEIFSNVVKHCSIRILILIVN